MAGLLGLLFTYAFFCEYLPPWRAVHLWSDAAGYHYPLQAYAFDALRHHRIPLWDASIYCGISFVGNVQAAFLYPPTWLMYAAARGFPQLPFQALEMFSFLHVWLAFWLAYLWLRGRAGPMASVLGASVFAFSGFVLWELLHTGALCAAAWLPLALWGIDESGERRDWRPLWKVAAASALAFLAGYTAAWIVNCAIAAVYAAAGPNRRRVLPGTCVALAASVVLAMVQLLPALEARSLMMPESKYGPGAWNGRQLLLSYFLPNWFDYNPGHATNYEPGCPYFYLGLPGIFGVVWAFGRRTVGRCVQPLVGLAAALLLANPPERLVHLVEAVPAVDRVMQPFNFYTAVGAMAALIAALGLDAFLNARRAARRAFPWWAIAVLVAGMAVWAGHQLRLWLFHGDRLLALGHSLIPFAIGLAFFSAAFWTFGCAASRERGVLAAALLLFAGIDYKVYGAARWFEAQPGDLDDEHDAHGMRGMNMAVFETLWSHRDYRIACDEDASPYSTDLRFYGLATPQGFDPFLPAQYRGWIERRVPFRTNRLFFPDLKNEGMLQALGVRYVITHEGAGSDPWLAGNAAFRRIGLDDSYYRVYEYLRAVPPYGWEDGRSGAVEPVAWKPERREFLTVSAEGGRFVLWEQFFPGWRASVDGRAVPIERWDTTFQAIAVPPGKHRIRFLFRPASVEIGAAISGCALAGLLAAIAADYRARRRSQAPAAVPRQAAVAAAH